MASHPVGKHRVEKVEVEDPAEGERPEHAYRAAAVVFFTRKEPNAGDKRPAPISQVLLAQEERKMQASQLGLEQKGKVDARVLVFPMGRKEKKDKNDAVETAKREYIEETTDFGGLSQYLDFAEWEAGEEVEAENVVSERDIGWSGRHNLALYFAPASMVVLFCEVPKFAAAGCSGECAESEEQAKKRRKTIAALAAAPKPSPNYHVGRTGHLEPVWVDAAELRKVAESSERAPSLSILGKSCHFFPTAASSLRLPEARVLLGLPAAPATTVEGSGGKAPAGKKPAKKSK